MQLEECNSIFAVSLLRLRIPRLTALLDVYIGILIRQIDPMISFSLTDAIGTVPRPYGFVLVFMHENLWFHFVSLLRSFVLFFSFGH